MNKEEMKNKIAQILCNKETNITWDKCYIKSKKTKNICNGSEHCRIAEKTKEQLRYILSSINENIFLEACPGSGKTEVVGMKAAYEINKWDKNLKSGIAVLTFTNDATNVIKSRVNQFSKKVSFYPHYIGTLSSFIHGYIAQAYGYNVMYPEKCVEDTSFRIIDRDIDAHKNKWLNKYKCSIPYISKKGNRIDIFAHQICYDWEEEDFSFEIGKVRKTVSEYYSSEEFQEFVLKERNKRGQPWYFKKEYIEKQFSECKNKFIKDRFATYEDLNCIAYKVLNKNYLVDRISKRFKLIIVDECQDLSWIEIQILNKLMKNGTKLHFVGDVNQSIFEFKKTNPEYMKKYVMHFKKLQLTDNFRSCQPIVNISNKLMNIQNSIIGKNKNKFGDNSNIYIEYETPDQSIKKYIKLLEYFQVDKKESSIIVKQNSMKDALIGNFVQHEKHLLISSIQLWSARTPYLRIKALEYAGKQISKWFGGAKSKRDYYCPQGITSPFVWKMYLKDVLNKCYCNSKLSNYNRKYAAWYKDARIELPKILINIYINLEPYDEINREWNDIFTGIWYRANEAQQNIRMVDVNCKNENNISILTVHGSKGCTYDSTLVVSSVDGKSESGHWKKHWINGSDEDKRIGYVASTRAKYLLVWAVPKLDEKDKTLIESYGFRNYFEVME